MNTYTLTGYLPDRDPALFARVLSDAGVSDPAGWALSDTELSAPDEASPDAVTAVAATFARRVRTGADVDAEFARRLRERYSLDAELYYARIGTGAALGVYELQDGEADLLAEYQRFVEELRAWKHAEKAALEEAA